jgi:L-serine deaminase
MIRVHIQLTEEQARKLRKAAREQGVSLAQIVRRCIDRGIAEELAAGPARYARASRLVGKFRDRQSRKDVSTEHDGHLDRAFE